MGDVSTGVLGDSIGDDVMTVRRREETRIEASESKACVLQPTKRANLQPVLQPVLQVPAALPLHSDQFYERFELAAGACPFE